MAPAGAAIAQIQAGALATSSTGNVTPTLPAASTAGTLLVAVTTNATAGNAFTAPSGWTSAIVGSNACCGRVQIWYRANNPGGITSAAFTSSGGNVAAQLSEWNGVLAASPVDGTGQASHVAAISDTISTTANLTQNGELGITAFETNGTNMTSLGSGSGWAHLFSDLTSGRLSDYRIGLSSGAAGSETEIANPSVSWMAAIATFKAATCSGGSLGLSAPASTSFPSFALDGTDQTATTDVILKPDDETSAHSGWNVTATSTTFNDGSGHTLPMTATVATAASAQTTGGNCVLPTNSTGYPVTLPAGATAPTAVKLYNAAAATGQGPTNVDLTFRLSLPANTYRGMYASTWTFAVVSGP